MRENSGGAPVPQDVTETKTRPKIERLTNPESAELKEFHDFLCTIFNRGEVDPLEVFQEELGRQDPNVRFLCYVAKEKNEVKSVAYASLIGDVFAIRFLATEVNSRGSGISKELDQRMLADAKKLGSINSMVAEAVERSESYWNKVEVEEGNTLRRLYYANPKTGEPNTEKQVFYRLPPFVWNPDGTPVEDHQQFENLQVAIKDFKDNIPVEKLDEILHIWWKTWYIRPREQFESDEAFKRHQQYVMGVLENEIIKPMKDSGQEYVTPLAKTERLKKGQPANE